MAHKKIVQNRSYPYLYNVDMTVGSRKSLTKTQKIESVKVGGGRFGMSVPTVKTTTTLTSSFEPNKRDDVMLVQYLLKRVYQRGHHCNPQLSQESGAATLKIDGMYGPKTARAIEQFQLEMRRNGQNIATDGCVDKEVGDDAYSSISKTGYTISWLNKYYWILYPELAPNLPLDPECPAELSKSLSNSAW